MASGKVKWFNNRRGFGFIAQDSGKDIFVHHSSILGKGYKTLDEGENVSFDLVDHVKGPKAENVKRAPSGPPKAPPPQIHRGLRMKKKSGPHRGRADPPAAGTGSRRRAST